MTIDSVTNNYLCSSCGACSVACPVDAITFIESSGGYLFPRINSDACTQCGLCFKVCPGKNLMENPSEDQHENFFVGSVSSAYVGFANNELIHQNGQSGGIVTALLDYLIQTENVRYVVVSIMREGIPPRGESLVVTDSHTLIVSQKSKYTPIPLLATLKEIPNDEHAIAIVGLPCHMQGLQNLQNMIPSWQKRKIIKIGLVCQKVMTTGGIDYMIHQSGIKNVVDLIFRDTGRTGYPGAPIVRDSDNNETILPHDAWSSIKEIFTPLRCRLCFDKINVFSDIVCGDPHRIPGAKGKKQSLVLTRTDIGDAMIEDALDKKIVTLRPVDIKVAVDGQRIREKMEDWHASVFAWRLKRGNRSFSNCKEWKRIWNIAKKKKLLSLSLKIDSFENRNDLYNFISVWLEKEKRKRKNIFFRLYRKINKVYTILRNL